MKKTLLILLAAFFVSLPVTAQAEDSKTFEFFTDDVPRYQGFAIGAGIINQWAIGDYSQFALCNLGGGIDAEFTLPLNLPKNIDLGLSGGVDYLHVFPKPDTPLKSDEELRFAAGFWMRMPFTIKGNWFAFQPELSFGGSIFTTQGQNGSNASGGYFGSVIGFAPAVRWIPGALPDFEFEATPLFTVTPELNSHSTIHLGAKIGVIYHIQSFIAAKVAEKKAKKEAELAEQKRIEREKQEEEARLQREEEERKKAEIERLKREAEQNAADEAERQRIQEEIRKAEEEARIAEEARKRAEEEAARIAEEERKKAEEEAARIAAEEARKAEIASWPNPIVTLEVGPQNFTPDGDGLSDTVRFMPKVQYIEEAPESWTLKITDPQGNAFRTFKGLGELPESFSWDGKSDKGETVVSKNTYTAQLSVIPGRADRLRTKETVIQTEAKVSTGLLLQVIVPEHEWKIVVQSISFDPDAATFNKLTAEQISANHETLDEVAQQIKDHPGAKVIIEGYANNISGTEKENLEELVPLSQKRAEAIVEELIKRGIDAEILSAKGMGGANPLASRKDKANWWKNRRVEFKITK